MSAGHSKGPWKWRAFRDGDDDDYGELVDAEGRVLFVPAIDSNFSESDGDLMAAAPEWRRRALVAEEENRELWRVLGDILEADAGTNPDAKFIALCNAHKLVAKREGR